MPYVFDMSKAVWPEDADDDGEPLAPPASAFVYLSPPELSGAVDPVRFEIPSPLEPAAGGASAGAAAEGGSDGGLLRRLLGAIGLGAPRAPRSPRGVEADARYADKLLGALAPALGAAEVQLLYCRYDGGNDEGFAWIDGAQTADGRTLTLETLTSAAIEAGVLERLTEAGLLSPSEHMSDAQQLRELLEWELPGLFATLLLGRGFGTGEYSMFGAFTVDLEAQVIVDDRNAAPVVRNIELGEA